MFTHGWLSSSEEPSDPEALRNLARWSAVRRLRSVADKALELARQPASLKLGKALEAQLTVFLPPSSHLLAELRADDAFRAQTLGALLVSDLVLKELSPGVDTNQVSQGAELVRFSAQTEDVDGSPMPVTVETRRCPGAKCPRCWRVGNDHPEDELCPRCKDAVSRLPPSYSTERC